MWYGSFAITLTVLVFILPTYWVIWTLARRITFNPFKTARVFHAPVVQYVAQDLDTKELFKNSSGKEGVQCADLITTPLISPDMA